MSQSKRKIVFVVFTPSTCVLNGCERSEASPRAYTALNKSVRKNAHLKKQWMNKYIQDLDKEDLKLFFLEMLAECAHTNRQSWCICYAGMFSQADMPKSYVCMQDTDYKQYNWYF